MVLRAVTTEPMTFLAERIYATLRVAVTTDATTKVPADLVKCPIRDAIKTFSTWMTALRIKSSPRVAVMIVPVMLAALRVIAIARVAVVTIPT